nr:unnamed protein product [Callosobruchus analis]
MIQKFGQLVLSFKVSCSGRIFEDPDKQRTSVTRDNLGLFHINVESVRNKIHGLEMFLEDFNTPIVCLTEHDLTIEEAQMFSIKWVSCVYRSTSVVISENADYVLFIALLEKALTLLQNKDIITAGDFNTHFERDNKYCTNLLDLMSTYGLQKMLKSNTRKKSCIDNIFINFNIELCKTQIATEFMFDHLGQLLMFRVPSTSTVKTTLKECRPITEQGKLIFFNLVENINWDFIKDPDSNKEFETFIIKIQICLHTAFPKKMLPAQQGDNL